MRSRRAARLMVRPLERRLAPAVFTVTNTNDTGAGSLRAAILAANANPGADDIVFDATFFSVPRSIVVASAPFDITDAATITGTSAANCTINGNKQLQMFRVNGPGVFDVGFTRLSIINGLSFSGPAGIQFFDERITVHDCTLTGHKNQGGGGGAVGQSPTGYIGGGGSLTITSSRITGNTTSDRGGGINVRNADPFVIRGTTIAGNSSSGNGGGLAVQGAPFTIEDSTISGNFGGTFTNAAGGGVYFSTPFGATTITVRNSTVSSNTSGGYGGGLFAAPGIISQPITFRIQNATIASNRAFRGGGVGAANSPLVTTIIESTIVSGNTSTLAGSPDFILPNLTARASAIGSTSGVTSFNNLGGNFIGVALSLGPLASNGGPTQTHALLAGSPIIDAGENPAGLSLDQRGLPRNYGTTDIGAFEYLPPGKPYATGTFANVTAAAPTIPLVVTYTDDTAIQVSSLTDNDLRVTGPGGFLGFAKFVGVDNPTDGTPRVATYSLAGPGGSWDPADAGQYAVFVEAGQVFDTSGNGIPFGQLGSFSVQIPLNAVVTNTNDSGPGSLRQAVLDTNANPAADSITFALSGAATITLASPLVITGSVSVIGPGADLLTVSGGAATQIFAVNSANPAAVAFSGLTITGGQTTVGGGLLVEDETVTLTDMVFAGNRATTNGGAVRTGGELVATRVTFRDNLARATPPGTTADGGAVYLMPTARPTFIDCVFDGNEAEDDGGAIHTTSSTMVLTVTGSTFFDNVAADGAAISLFGSTLIARNSTFSANSATGQGGAIYTSGNWNLTLTNSTLADNAAQKGGGLAGPSSSGGSLTITSSVLANAAAFAPDILAGATVATATTSLIRSPLGHLDSGANSIPPGVAPRLGPLADNGGPTPTRLPLPGSPLFDRGANPASLATDQRGAGFPRTLGAATDIGAAESADATGTPVALTLGNANVTTPGATTYQIKVTYTDDVALDATTFGNDDIRVRDGLGFDVPAQFVSVSAPGNGSPRVVTYEFIPPGGSWDAADNGVYFAEVQPGAVTDTDGNPVPAGAVGGFRVTLARSFVVTNTNDAGPGSLRQAVIDANLNAPAADTITFDPAVFASPSTIALTGGELTATDPLTINGPGQALLTINAGKLSRHFTLEAPGSKQPFTVNNLTLTGGQATVSPNFSGGSIISSDDAIVIANVHFIANTSSAGGGAVQVTNAGSLGLTGVTFTNNATSFSGGGGAVNMGSGSALSVANSSFVGNSASYQGGALASSGTALLFDLVTFQNNTASSSGGAVIWGSSNPLTITRSTFTDNKSGDDGGAIRSFFSATLTLQESQLTGNSAASDGGAVYWGGGATTIRDVTVAANTAGADGGGLFLYSSSSSLVLLDRVAVVNNVSKSTSSTGGGGGLRLAGSNSSSATVTLQNSTFSGNSAAAAGGGIGVNITAPVVTIRNATITNNTAGGTNGGGGLGRTSTGASTITLESVIISGNAHATNADMYSPGTVSAQRSALGSIVGVQTFLSLTGNLPFGTDVKLGPLANNGGPTPTHALLPGSPAINAGSNPAGLVVDQRGFARAVGTIDIGAYELEAPAKVASVVVNNGDPQRSRVTTLSVAFDRPVTLPPNPASAFTLVRQSDSAAVTLAANVANGSATTVTLTFTGGPVEFGSLADGRYTLTVLAAEVTGPAGPLDGNGDGTGGDDYSLVGTPANGLFRLFGDADGNGQTSISDFLAFRLAFLGSSPAFDFDGNGTVDAGDFLQFRLRFLQAV